MSYYYRRTEPQLWTVGHDTAEGAWETDSDHDVREEAAQRVAFLNGGEAAGANPAQVWIVVHRPFDAPVDVFVYRDQAAAYADFYALRAQHDEGEETPTPVELDADGWELVIRPYQECFIGCGREQVEARAVLEEAPAVGGGD